MAFLRFNRDKRGYEHFYLVEPTTNRRGKTRARVLYWFRSPPNVKVGREPFDGEARRALEAQNPRVVFDWRKIVETPIPSADAERWRERRRIERIARRPSPSGSDATTIEQPQSSGGAEQEVIEPSDRPSGPDQTESIAVESIALDAAERQEDSLTSIEPTEPTVEIAAVHPLETGLNPTPAVSSRRRRRRRRRGGRGRQLAEAPRPEPDDAARRVDSGQLNDSGGRPGDSDQSSNNDREGKR